jgi:NTE family protein
MKDDSEDVGNPDAAELLTRSIDVMQGAIARLKLAAYTPDKVVEIPRDACSFFDFYKTAEMSDLGYQRACKALDDLGL